MRQLHARSPEAVLLRISIRRASSLVSAYHHRLAKHELFRCWRTSVLHVFMPCTCRANEAARSGSVSENTQHSHDSCNQRYCVILHYSNTRPGVSPSGENASGFRFSPSRKANEKHTSMPRGRSGAKTGPSASPAPPFVAGAAAAVCDSALCRMKGKYDVRVLRLGVVARFRAEAVIGGRVRPVR